MIRFLYAGAMVMLLVTTAHADDDPVYKEYVQSLLLVPGKAQDEFQKLATLSPLLTSYALALFAEKRCSIPAPSEALIAAAGGDKAFETEAGKRVFAVTGVVATMTFPTPADEAGFCVSAKSLVDTGERYAAGQH